MHGTGREKQSFFPICEVFTKSGYEDEWNEWQYKKVENIVNIYYYNDIMGRCSILIFIGHILNYLYMNALKDYWLLYKIIACVDFNDKHFQTYGGKWIHKLFWIRRPCHANHLVYN